MRNCFIRSGVGLFVLVAWTNYTSFAADISFSGATVVCPGQEETYTASASNAFGSQKGCFLWWFYLNGSQIGVEGGITCPCYSQLSTDVVNFTWPSSSTGQGQIKIRFLPTNNALCPVSEKIINVTVRSAVPESLSDADGGPVQFCSSGQTRTISVPTVPFNVADYCYWHNKYDWIVPSGWTVVPAAPHPPGEFEAIPGGIRTFATAVNVTAPTTTLSPGYTGNYSVTVRTEPVWPWPKEITKQIWVGKPNYNNLVLSVDNGELSNCDYTYADVGTAYPGPSEWITAYEWRIPYSSDWNIEEEYGGIADFQWVEIEYYDQYPPLQEAIQIRAYNSCGWSYWKEFWVDVDDCAGYAAFTFSPNPATDELTISNSGPGDSEIVIHNSSMEQVFRLVSSDDVIKIPVTRLPEGMYYLQVSNKKCVMREQILIRR